MDRVPVSSSNIESIGYDAGSETLEVEFKTQSIYQYNNVPQFMHEQLMQAPSVGTFFNANIKNAYACAKV
jgi:KTSC domain